MQYGRKANGPQVRRTIERRAYDIALSVVNHRREGREKSLLENYGISDPTMVALIQTEIMKMTEAPVAA